MAKYRLDDILSQLGVPGAEDKAPKEPPRKHRIDQAEDSFGPLPSVPANQRGFGEAAPTPVDDPAVKKAAQPAPQVAVGQALSDIYQPDAAADQQNAGRLGELLVSRGLITAQQLAAAQQVIKQSPGRRLGEVLVEQGVDEASIQSCVAERAGVPFERIDLD
jgi:type IV pilus assembly protein PilB